MPCTGAIPSGRSRWMEVKRMRRSLLAFTEESAPAREQRRGDGGGTDTCGTAQVVDVGPGRQWGTQRSASGDALCGPTRVVPFRKTPQMMYASANPMREERIWRQSDRAKWTGMRGSGDHWYQPFSCGSR